MTVIVFVDTSDSLASLASLAALPALNVFAALLALFASEPFANALGESDSSDGILDASQTATDLFSLCVIELFGVLAIFELQVPVIFLFSLFEILELLCLKHPHATQLLGGSRGVFC